MISLPMNPLERRHGFVMKNDIDIDTISRKNFFDVMKSRLIIPAEDRDEEDIEILKTCTKYLDFFANIMHVDPEDRLNSHYNGCKYLQYRALKKGDIVTKHKDNSEEFYIILSGKIAFWVPKQRTKIEEELDSIKWIRKKIGFGFDIKQSQLDKLSEEIGAKHVQNRHIKKFKIIKDRENMIVYRDEYFREVNLGLVPSDIPNDSWILTDQDVSILFVQNF